jgi:hypothetical protein
LQDNELQLRLILEHGRELLENLRFWRILLVSSNIYSWFWSDLVCLLIDSRVFLVAMQSKKATRRLPKHNELCVCLYPATSRTQRQERRREPQDRKAVDNPKTGKTTLYDRGLVLFLQSLFFQRFCTSWLGLWFACLLKIISTEV